MACSLESEKCCELLSGAEKACLCLAVFSEPTIFRSSEACSVQGFGFGLSCEGGLWVRLTTSRLSKISSMSSSRFFWPLSRSSSSALSWKESFLASISFGSCDCCDRLVLSRVERSSWLSCFGWAEPWPSFASAGLPVWK